MAVTRPKLHRPPCPAPGPGKGHGDKAGDRTLGTDRDLGALQFPPIQPGQRPRHFSFTTILGRDSGLFRTRSGGKVARFPRGASRFREKPDLGGTAAPNRAFAPGCGGGHASVGARHGAAQGPFFSTLALTSRRDARLPKISGDRPRRRNRERQEPCRQSPSGRGVSGGQLR